MWRWLIGVSGVLGPLLLTLASTKPEDAISNVGGWIKLLGVDQVPALLATSQADNVLRVLGGCLIGVALGAASQWLWRRRLERQLEPKPIETTALDVDTDESPNEPVPIPNFQEAKPTTIEVRRGCVDGAYLALNPNQNTWWARLRFSESGKNLRVCVDHSMLLASGAWSRRDRTLLHTFPDFAKGQEAWVAIMSLMGEPPELGWRWAAARPDDRALVSYGPAKCRLVFIEEDNVFGHFYFVMGSRINDGRPNTASKPPILVGEGEFQYLRAWESSDSPP